MLTVEPMPHYRSPAEHYISYFVVERMLVDILHTLKKHSFDMTDIDIDRMLEDIVGPYEKHVVYGRLDRSVDS